MKVLLMKDVYKLGLAGEVKKVADGYGRNYLIPQGLAILASPGALKQAERIRQVATARREILNEEMGHVAVKLVDVVLKFPARAGETGKLYGSITSRMLVDSLQENADVEITTRQIDSQPIRQLGLHNVNIRLTIDLVPQIQVLVYREGESPESAMAEALAAEAAEAAELLAAEAAEAELEDALIGEASEEAEVLEAEEDAEVVETEAETEAEAVVEIEAEVETEAVAEVKADVEAEEATEAEVVEAATEEEAENNEESA
jgi:large subunit ribosomal protein L9